MIVKDFIDSFIDEDILFVIADSDGEDIAHIWKSDYRINKEKYQHTSSLVVDGWYAELTHICIIVK